MGQGGMVNFLSKLKVFRSEQSSLPRELAATFTTSLEAPKIELLYKEATPRNSEQTTDIKSQRAYDVNTEDKVQIEETSCLMIKAKQCLIAVM